MVLCKKKKKRKKERKSEIYWSKMAAIIITITIIDTL
jgi:hypothetical protein